MGRTYPTYWKMDGNLSDRIFRLLFLRVGFYYLRQCYTTLSLSKMIEQKIQLDSQSNNNNLEFMDNQQFPLVDSDLIFQWFFNRPKKEGKKALLIKLIEEISRKNILKICKSMLFLH